MNEKDVIINEKVYVMNEKDVVINEKDVVFETIVCFLLKYLGDLLKVLLVIFLNLK